MNGLDLMLDLIYIISTCVLMGDLAVEYVQVLLIVSHGYAREVCQPVKYRKVLRSSL